MTRKRRSRRRRKASQIDNISSDSKVESTTQQSTEADWESLQTIETERIEWTPVEAEWSTQQDEVGWTTELAATDWVTTKEWTTQQSIEDEWSEQQSMCHMMIRII
jgi:hypothetical protein